MINLKGYEHSFTILVTNVFLLIECPGILFFNQTPLKGDIQIEGALYYLITFKSDILLEGGIQLEEIRYLNKF